MTRPHSDKPTGKAATRNGKAATRSDKSRGGLTRIFNALRYSLQGLKAGIRHEAAFRQEVLMAAVLLPIAILLPVGLTGKAMLIFSVLMVLVTELLNSALECAIDYISQETHPFAKRAKDMGSAAVFLSLVGMALVWLLVICDRFV